MSKKILVLKDTSCDIAEYYGFVKNERFVYPENDFKFGTKSYIRLKSMDSYEKRIDAFDVMKVKSGDKMLIHILDKDGDRIEFEIHETVSQKTNVNKKEKESGVMKFDFKNMLGGLKFGKCEDVSIAMGMDGRFYYKRKDGDYVRYDSDMKQIVNTHDVKFDMGSAMVVPAQSVNVGELILDKDSILYITKNTDNKITGVCLNTGRNKTIIKEVSAFGFSFYSKIFNIMDGIQGQGGFNGFNPMMMAMMSDDEGGGTSSDMMQMMMMSQMFSGGQNPMTNMFGQPQQAQPANTQPKLMTSEEIDEQIKMLKELKKQNSK